MIISPERAKYHEILGDFIVMLKPSSSIYDIGKSNVHDYKPLFQGHDFKVIDKDKEKHPDLVIDIEDFTYGAVCGVMEQVDAILCNGVIEQCNDPMQLIRSCSALLKEGGLILFGFCLLGYPPHEVDYFRFTEQGAKLAIKRYGFNIIQTHIVKRYEFDSYIYVLAKKGI